jgi:hypothetical protein
VVCPGPAQEVREEEDYVAYQEHPRLLLPERRLRLLRRERERESLRWQQFSLLIRGKVRMTEPGFALALYSQVSEDASYCRMAAEWALGGTRDLRQVALVYDWCRAAAPAAQVKSLAATLRRALERASASKAIDVARDRILAAISLGDDDRAVSEPELRRQINGWWRGQLIPRLRSGSEVLARPDAYAVLEVLHVVRDNLGIDLRDDAPLFFRDLPRYLLLSYYPASYPAAENEYRIPSTKGGQPDLDVAVLSRAAELAMVALDPNLRDNQFLQGWLIHDRFLMRSTYGIPYEFLWGNPYQPGVSYYHMPLVHHDETAGTLYLRSSWEDDARWVGWFGGELQVFEDGVVDVVRTRQQKVIRVRDAQVVVGPLPMRLVVEDADVKVVFLVGLTPRQRYEMEIDDEELREETSDGGGILRFEIMPRPGLNVRIRASGLTSNGATESSQRRVTAGRTDR